MSGSLVRDVMTTEVVTAEPSTPLARPMRTMRLVAARDATSRAEWQAHLSD